MSILPMTRAAAFAGVLCGLLLTVPALAEAPEAISYQGLLTDGQGVVVPDGTYNITFGIYDAVELGTLQMPEIDVVVAVKDGLYNVILSGAGLADAFQSAQTYMEIKINTGPAPGLPVTLSPRQQITSVPYALNAGEARKAIYDTDVIPSSPSITISTVWTPLGSVSVDVPASGSYAIEVDGHVILGNSNGFDVRPVVRLIKEEAGGAAQPVRTFSLTAKALGVVMVPFHHVLPLATPGVDYKYTADVGTAPGSSNFAMSIGTGVPAGALDEGGFLSVKVVPIE